MTPTTPRLRFTAGGTQVPLTYRCVSMEHMKALLAITLWVSMTMQFIRFQNTNSIPAKNCDKSDSYDIVVTHAPLGRASYIYIWRTGRFYCTYKEPHCSFRSVVCYGSCGQCGTEHGHVVVIPNTGLSIWTCYISELQRLMDLCFMH